MRHRRPTLRTATAFAAIAAMLAFAQTCVIRGGMSASPAIAALATPHAGDHASAPLDHAHAEAATGHRHEAAAVPNATHADDDCCETPGAPTCGTCCSTWSPAEARIDLSAPTFAIAAVLTPAIAAPATAEATPTPHDTHHSGAPPPGSTFLRL